MDGHIRNSRIEQMRVYIMENCNDGLQYSSNSLRALIKTLKTVR